MKPDVGKFCGKWSLISNKADVCLR